MNAVGLDGIGNLNEVFVNHGHKCSVVFGCEVTKNLVERLNVIAAVVGGQRNSGEKHLDVGVAERSEDGVEVAAGLVGRHSTKAVIAAKFDQDDDGMELQYGAKAGDGVFGGGPAGAQVRYFVVVAALV